MSSTRPRWIGLDNYAYMFGRDARFRKALQVTFTFVAFAVPAKLIFALAVAMVLDKGIRAIGIVSRAVLSALDPRRLDRRRDPVAATCSRPTA